MEEWISLQEFMKRRKIGNKVALQMIHNKEVECQMTPGGRYKIKVGGDTVSKELYNKMLERAIRAETTIQVLKTVLLGKEINQ